MTIREVSEKYGVSADTIRYYERVGLLPPVPRKPNGIRDFDETSCNWLSFIKCMRAAGVQVEALSEFVALQLQGGKEESCRKILLEQRVRIERQILESQKTLERLNYKISHFEEIIREKNF